MTTRLTLASALTLAVIGAIPPAAAAWTWPVRGPVISRFAYRAASPFARGQRRGVDIAAPSGTPVVAACSGRVRFAGAVGTAGRTVSMACGRFVVSYLHLDAIRTRHGARLRTGDPLGTVGATGRRHERRPHLSFGVRRVGTRWAYVDPLRLLPAEHGIPPDTSPAPRGRRAPPPLGPAPASEPKPARVPHRGDAPFLAHAERSPALGLPLGALWLPAGALLAAAAMGAPLARSRVRYRGRRSANHRTRPQATRVEA